MKRIVPFAAVVVPLAAVVWLAYPRTAQSSGVREAIARARPDRVFPARYSVPTRYQPCDTVPLPADGTVPREECGQPGDAPNDMVRLAGHRASLDPDTLHASALATMAWWKGKGESLDAAIDQLNAALLFAGDSVPVLVDLSAAYLARAQQAQSPGDLVAALQNAGRAANADPRNDAAWWNLALAASALGLEDEAVNAWTTYLALDSRSPWADEARRRRARVEQPPATAAEPATLDTAHSGASLLRWDSILGEWGSALLADSGARAQSLLDQAVLLARNQALRGDSSLADAVELIRTARDPDVKRRLAEAHRDYSAGLELFAARTYLPAAQKFARVLELQPPSSALRAWADAYREIATSLLASRATTDSLLSRTDSVRYPLLTARVHWVRGKYLFDDGRFADALPHLSAAAARYAGLGESEGYGITRSLEGWARYEGGDTLVAYRYAHQALLSFRRAGSPRRMHLLLVDMSRYAARQGMYHAAVVIANQVGTDARQRDDTAQVAEAMLTRVVLGRFAGQAGSMSTIVDSAAALIHALAENESRRELTNILRYTRATQQQPGAMAASVAAGLDSAISFFTRGGKDLWRTAALMRRAEERLHAGDHARAQADLDTITAVFRRNAGNEGKLHLRSAVLEEARSRFDQLVMLHLRAGQVDEALRALDRGRVSLAPTGGERPVSNGRLAAPPGESVVNYALIGDTLFAWTLRGTSVALHRQRVDADSLKIAIEQANTALERPEREERAMPHLVRLYDLLIRPVRDRLMQDSTLVVIADGEVAGVPFASLRDTARGRYLVDDHPVRYAASLAEARRPPRPAPLPGGARALLVADPDFDDGEYPRLAPLPGARREVRSLLAMYPGADTISGIAATLPALLGRVRGAGVIHYAGHAVFDDTRPERSHLVLAGRGDAGRLTADAATALDLGGVRLVVLSACSTLRGRRGRSGGFSGLSGALLSAGADGVVGSVWTVNDTLALPLMHEFHRAYTQSGHAAKALRAAQLRMIREEHGPSAWAGFRYMGR